MQELLETVVRSGLALPGLPPLVTDVILLGVGAVAGVFVSAAAKQPRLVNNGGGAGTLSIYALPGSVGISWGETRVLGRLIAGSREFRLPHERLPAEQVTASLHDATGKHVCALFWSKPPSGELHNIVSLSPGEQASLHTFERVPGADGYFVVQARSDGAPGKSLPPDVRVLHGDKHYTIRLRYRGRNKPVVLPIAVEERVDGSISVRTDVSITSL